MSIAESAFGASSLRKRAAKKRGVLLGASGLGLVLLLTLGAGQVTGQKVMLSWWLAAVAITAVVQGLVWLIPQQGWDARLGWDSHYVYVPMLAAGWLFNLYMYIAPGMRLMLLMGWFAAMLFMAGTASFIGVTALGAMMAAGYLAVIGLGIVHGAPFVWPVELTVALIFLLANVYAAVVFERLRRERNERRALYEDRKRAETEASRLFKETARRVQQLQALRAVDLAIAGSLDLRIVLGVLLDQVTAQLHVAAADILRLDPHTQVLEFVVGRGFRTAALQHSHLKLGEGHAGRAALEQHVVTVPVLAEARGDFLARSPLLRDEGFVAYLAVPLIAKGRVEGVLELFDRGPLHPDEEWLGYLETLAGQAAIAIDYAILFRDLQRAHRDLTFAYDATIEGWSRALDIRDRETEGHTQRVTELTVRLATAMGVNEAEMVHIRRGALLHDIGKMGIPDSILLKPAPLTEQEWEIMHRHPASAYELLSPIDYLRPALDIPYCHHEKWDGTGYPRGLKGEQIPLAARIFAVIDVWDALRSDRPYRPAWLEQAIWTYLRSQAGLHFYLAAVQAFETLMEEERGLLVVR